MKQCTYIVAFLIITIKTVIAQSQLVSNNLCVTTLGADYTKREIHTVYNDNQNLYVAGNFSPLSSSASQCSLGISRHKIYRTSTLYGGIDPTWDANPNNTRINGEIYAIEKMNNIILLGGSISNHTSNPSPAFVGLLGVSESNGSIVNTYTLGGSNPYVNSLDYKDGVLMVGGNFTSFNGVPCNNNIAIITFSSSVISGNFSHQAIINPSSPTITAGNVTNVKQVKIYNGKYYAIAFDPALNGNSIIELNTSNNTIKRRLTIHPANELNYFCEQNDSLYIFPRTQSVFGSPMVRFINNIDMTNYQNLLPFNMKNWSFGYKLNVTSGVGAVFTKNFDATWYPPTQDNTNYLYYPYVPGMYQGPFEPEVILQGNKFYMYYENTAGDPIYAHVFYKSGNKCYQQVDTANLWEFRQLNFNKLKRLFIHGDKAYAIKKTKTWTNENEVAMFCIKPNPLMKPRAVNNYTSFCAGNTYSFVLPNPTILNQFTWQYTGTGATFLNSNNDTVYVAFNDNATPGQLRVWGKTGCYDPQDSDTSFLQINFIPKPQLQTKLFDTLNCKNNGQLILTSTSTVNNSYTKWFGPNTSSLGVLGSSLTTTMVGTYTTVLTETVTGCSNTHTVIVSSDFSILPILNLQVSYTAGCQPPTVNISAIGFSPYDSLYWEAHNIYYSNPITYLPVNNSNTITAINKNRQSGCLNYKYFDIHKSSGPTYTLLSQVSNPPASLPQFNELTCINDSTLLHVTSQPEVKLQWKKSNGDTVANPYYAKSPGVYQLLAWDTLSGCKNTSFFGQINVNKVAPTAIITTPQASINCSYNTAVLGGMSLNPNTSVFWKNAVSNYTYSNPASVSDTGWYSFHVTNNINGCVNKDSIKVSKYNTLTLSKSSNTLICYGHSANVYASPIGGTPPFTNVWENNTSSGTQATFYNKMQSEFITVTVSDNANCIGKDSIYIKVNTQLSDSVVTFKSCDPLLPKGEIQIHLKGGILPYQYSINNGLSFQGSNNFTNLSFGNYPILIKDSLGCRRSSSASISVNSNNPKVDFILNTSMMQADTFVIVDISNPKPDSIKWTLPPQTTIISGTNPAHLIIVSQDTGLFVIIAKAYFGNCIDSLIKTVHFAKYDSLSTKNGMNRGIKIFNVYPNPTTGNFTVDLEFYRKQQFTVWVHASNGAIILQSPSYFSIQQSIPMQMPPSAPGTYYIRVVSEFDSKQKSFILSN